MCLLHLVPPGGFCFLKLTVGELPSVYFRFKQISKYTSDYESQVFSLCWRSDKYRKEEVSSECVCARVRGR